MTECRFWIRERGRSRNKWHVSSMNLQPYAFSGIAIKAWDHTPCGKDYHSINASEYETQELPNGTLPTDASGTCMHCLRWLEVERREEEAAERERRSRVFYVNGSETAVELPWKDGRKYEQA